jgi:hypothetical protein
MTDFTNAFFNGVYDSLQFPICLFVLYGSSTLSQRTVKATMITCCIFLVSFLLHRFVMKPILQLLPMPQGNYSVIFLMLWMYPTYALAFLLNSTNFAEIARRSFEIFGSNTKAKSKQVSILASDFVKLLHKNLFMFVHFWICFLVSSIPGVGTFIGILLLIFVGSFYSFEYHWIKKDWTFDQQLEYFESKWPYFFGFGIRN